jgi:hypothetical protein
MTGSMKTIRCAPSMSSSTDSVWWDWALSERSRRIGASPAFRSGARQEPKGRAPAPIRSVVYFFAAGFAGAPDSRYVIPHGPLPCSWIVTSVSLE